MENEHPYKEWENKKPRCEEFGFSESDIPRIKKAQERFENISSFVPSDELELLRKRREALRDVVIKEHGIKKKDPGLVVSLIILVGILAAIITQGFTDFSMGVVEIIAFIFLITVGLGWVFIILIQLVLEPLVLSPLDPIINKEYYEAEKQKAEQERQIEAQKKELEEQIAELEIKEAERHRKYVHTVFGEAYALSGNLKNYYNALKYYNNCRNSRSSDYWDRFQGGNGNDFEKACAKFLGNKGFLTRVTPIGPDQGVDIYASRDGLEYACQCKALGTKVPSGDVQKFIGVLVTGPYAEGFFFSLNGFSEKALQVAKTSPKKIYCLSKKELMEGKIR